MGRDLSLGGVKGKGIHGISHGGRGTLAKGVSEERGHVLMRVLEEKQGFPDDGMSCA